MHQFSLGAVTPPKSGVKTGRRGPAPVFTVYFGERASMSKRCIGRRRGGFAMSERAMNNLRELMDNIEQNSASIERKLSMNGSKPDSAIVMSAAKYHKALEMLAKE
jgi:hypothetical protein